MRWAIFTQTNAVVGHHEHGRDLGQSRKAHRRARIIGETHECAAIGTNAAVQRHAVHCGRHAMLANTPVHITTLAVVCVEHAHIAGLGIV